VPGFKLDLFAASASSSSAPASVKDSEAFDKLMAEELQKLEASKSSSSSSSAAGAAAQRGAVGH